MGRPSDAQDRLLAATLTLVWQKSVGAVTVEQICSAAGVRPGTFYHFFKSKSELIAAALMCHWKSRRPEMDGIFKADVPAAERIGNFYDSYYHWAVEQKRTHGRVLGSPYMGVASEVGDSDPVIHQTVQTILGELRQYLCRAIHDGNADGSLHVIDAARATRLVMTLGLGTMVSARVHNDPLVLRDMAQNVLLILGHAEGATV